MSRDRDARGPRNKPEERAVAGAVQQRPARRDSVWSRRPTAALRAAGPVFLGAPAVLGALVVTQSLGESTSIVLDERLAGLAAAVVMRAPMLAVLVIAAAATAIVRLAL